MGSKGPQANRITLPDNVVGAQMLPPTKIIPLVDFVISYGANNTAPSALATVCGWAPTSSAGGFTAPGPRFTKPLDSIELADGTRLSLFPADPVTGWPTH